MISRYISTAYAAASVPFRSGGVATSPTGVKLREKDGGDGDNYLINLYLVFLFGKSVLCISGFGTLDFPT